MWKALRALAGAGAVGAILAAALLALRFIQQDAIAKIQAQQAVGVVRAAQGQRTLDVQAARAGTRVITQLQPIIQQEKETVRAIQTAPGSDVLVDPRSAHAFYGGLCEQPWRAADPVCRPDPGGGPDAAPTVPPSAPAD